MRHSRSQKRLSVVMADEPLVGKDLTRRLRVVLVAIVIAFALTNFSSYLIGQAVRADTERYNRGRIAALERDFTADLEQRRKQRDAEVARQDAELRQLRRDACTLADRVQPRDDAVQRMRKRYGCTDGPSPAASRPAGAAPPSDGQRPSSAGGSSVGDSSSGPRPAPAAPGAARPSGAVDPPAPAPSPAPPASEPDDGLICLPLLGCAF